jgi:uncharacterized protein YecE (DUF72 family)
MPKSFCFCLCQRRCPQPRFLIDFHLFFTYHWDMILVGTSGFQYNDWSPIFYPKGLDSRLRLRYYSRHFGCCELGFTYYRLPEPIAVQQLISESGGALQFVFRIPFRVEDHPGNGDLACRFAASLWPLKEADQLAGVVAQFGPDFGFIRDNFRRLLLLRDSLRGIRLIAEFGCPDWLTLCAARHLGAERISIACIDGGVELRERTFYSATSDPAYVRFQGRNQSRWLKGDGSSQHNYLYSRAELAAAVPEIHRLEGECGRVLVVMNNPWRGQAVLNARMLQELLSCEIANCKLQIAN